MKKQLSIYMAAMVVMAALCGCGGSVGQTGETVQTGDAEQAVEGVITMNGSTSMEKFANALTESFMAKYPKVTATVEFTGSGAGIEAAANGTVDIGNSSRALKEEEKAKGLVENIVAIDGIGIVVNPSVTADNLTAEELKSIYTGQIANWSEIGAEDSRIVVIGREAGSGTRGAFEEILGLEEQCAYAQEIDSTGAVMAKVASTPGAIGYVSVDVIDDTVKALSLDGVAPTAEAIKDGSYALQRPFVMATKGEISEQSPAVRELFSYIDSDEGQELIAKVGLISAK